MKTYKEFITEAEQFKAFLKEPSMSGSSGSVSFEYKTGAISLKGQGDWKKIVNVLKDRNVKSLSVKSDLKKKVPAFVTKIFDKVKSQGYTITLSEK